MVALVTYFTQSVVNDPHVACAAVAEVGSYNQEREGGINNGVGVNRG